MEQNWLLAQLVLQVGVEQAGAPVQPAAQVVQPEGPEQLAQLGLQGRQVGAPLDTPQYWLAAQLLPQSGVEQVAPFQPGRQAVQVLAPVQEAQFAGQAVQAPLEQNWLAAQLVQTAGVVVVAGSMRPVYILPGKGNPIWAISEGKC
ncbi:hypothetical protein ABPG75_000651 [Micractinium tetrahymenae]